MVQWCSTIGRLHSVSCSCMLFLYLAAHSCCFYDEVQRANIHGRLFRISLNVCLSLYVSVSVFASMSMSISLSVSLSVSVSFNYYFFRTLSLSLSLSLSFVRLLSMCVSLSLSHLSFSLHVCLSSLLTVIKCQITLSPSFSFQFLLAISI